MSNGKSQSNNSEQQRRQAPDESKKEKREAKQDDHEQTMLDEGIEESFPASDPPSVGHVD